MIETVGSQLTQWDVGRVAQVTGEASHVHFANQGDSKAVIMEVVGGEAKIPDYLLQTGKTLLAYAVLDGRTLECKAFAVRKRERPENYIYEDDQRNYIYKLIANAEEAIKAANQAAENIMDAKERGEFDGYVSEDELTEMWLELSELREQRASVQSWPVLKTGKTWLYGSGFNYVKERTPITEIHFVKEYTPTGSETAFNPASSGSISGYTNGTIITICTNGADKIRLNADCINLFATMSNLQKFSGLELLDASLVENFSAAFFGNGLEEIDISSWHLERVTNATGVFNLCPNLKRVKFSKYGISAVTSTLGMFLECPELIEVDLGRGLTVVGGQMFKKCPKLETIKGLSSVTSIGEDAFLYTPNLKYVDLNPDLIQSIGVDACRLSSIEDIVDLSVVDLSLVGDMATRHKRWSADALNEIRNVTLPTVYIEVPGADYQGQYTDIKFCTGVKPGTTTEETYYVADSGCTALAIYHEWQAVNASTTQFSNFREWWTWFNGEYSAQNDGAVFADVNNMTVSFTIPAILNTIGWSGTTADNVVCASQLQTIVSRLSANKATFVSMQSVNIPGNHAVLIIGANASTGKLAVLDSLVVAPNPTIAWVRFEDIFCGSKLNGDGIADSITPHEYN